MSGSEELKTRLKGVVESLLNDNNVELKDLTQTVVDRIAGEFRAAGLITKDMEDSMLVMGLDNFRLAAKLMSACQTSLVMYPEENFPKFIAVLMRYGTMKRLAAEMESKFKQASESYIDPLGHNTLS